MESESLQSPDEEEGYIQFAAIVKTLSSVIKMHISQKGVVNPVVGAFQSLRDKNPILTFRAIRDELTQVQFTVVK